MPATPDRREFLKSAVGVAAAAGLAGLSPRARAAQPPAQTPRSLRIAHMTDTHVRNHDNAPTGFAQALDHMMNAPAKPDLLITGGDLVYDSFDAGEAHTQEQWEIYTNTLKDHCGIPIRHTIGNHDIWGWHKEKSKTTGAEPRWGKKWVTELLELPGRYYAFTRGPWKFIVLDSVQPHGPAGYKGGLDDEQFEWLQGELASTPAATPVCVVSHVPILHASTVFTDGAPGDQGWTVSAGEVFTDAIRMVNLFARHPNVKLALSGHIHVVERLDYQGVTYLNNGAVSGNWWRSMEKIRAERAGNSPAALAKPPTRCQPCYAVLDLHPDGKFDWAMHEYGWKL